MTQHIPPVLDADQLRRIESVHRGFLYQHLYAAGCLLIAPAAGYDTLLMERDEDIELLSADTHLYLQIKTRLQPLQHADIDGALSRFADLRTEHTEQRRLRRPRFGIVANIGPSPRLRQSIEAETWSDDVFMVWPNQPPPEEVFLPPAWPQLPHALQWCIEHAEAIPYTRLSGEALTWKLAALMQYVSTGTAPQQLHQIATAELPNLFEQLTIQLQHFPAAPIPYRPQEAEPSLESAERIRLVVGWSGAGKTAWASQVAQHSSLLCAYYDVGDTPGPALAASLAKELMAQFLGSRADIVSQIFLPGQTGLDSLRALDLIFAEQQLPVTVVVDNIHLLEPDDVRRVTQASPNIRYMLLARPSAAQVELEALLGVQAETLRGWSMGTVAEVFSAVGAHVDPLVATRVLRLTGGLPLYINNAAYLTREHYHNNAIAFCEDVEQQTHMARTQQEAILDRVMATLPPISRDIAAVLSLVDIPLTPDETRTLIAESLGLAPGVVARTLRDFTGLSVLRQLNNRDVILHDAFRVVAVGHRTDMDQTIIHRARISLKRLLIQVKAPSYQVQRLSLLLRLLQETGEIETLVDLSGDEYLHELGLSRELRANLESASNSLDLPPHSRFWALDTLAFWDIQEDVLPTLDQRLTRMAQLLPETRNGRREQTTLLMKQMLLSGKQGDIVKASSIYSALLQSIDEDTQLQRIVHYNFAVMLLHNKLYAEAEQEAFKLIMEYYEVLGLDLPDVIAQNPEAIAPKLADTPTQQDDLKHLADSLDVMARAVNAQGRPSGLSRMHALKFYDMAHAPRSLVRVAQDFIDELLRDFQDANTARSFIEQNLLPLTQKYGLLDYLVPIQAQYAVVLAYCGESRAALAEMERLSVFVDALPEEQRAEIANQYRLIEGITQGYIRLGVNNPSRVRYLNPQHPIRRPPKISRNAQCPCGSGKKYKRCHGR